MVDVVIDDEMADALFSAGFLSEADLYLPDDEYFVRLEEAFNAALEVFDAWWRAGGHKETGLC